MLIDNFKMLRKMITKLRIKYTDGKTNSKRKEFYKHWDDEAKQSIEGIEMPKIDKCFPYYNWKPGNFICL